LVGALSRAAADRGVQLDALVQLNLDSTHGGPRGGVAARGAARLADEIAAAAGLRLRGLMLVAPADLDPESVFDRLARAAAALRVEHPHADWISPDEWRSGGRGGARCDTCACRVRVARCTPG